MPSVALFGLDGGLEASLSAVPAKKMRSDPLCQSALSRASVLRRALDTAKGPCHRAAHPIGSGNDSVLIAPFTHATERRTSR